MSSTCINTYDSNNVTLLGNNNVTGGVTFAFTQRTGGVSLPPFESLNVGSNCNDDIDCVIENRKRVMDAMHVDPSCQKNLIMPNQVHGDNIVVVDDIDKLSYAKQEAEVGADGIVCTIPGVPVMLCFADCVPVILVSDNAFAVVHSGWRGTYAKIAGKALDILCNKANVKPNEVSAYIGPHIQADDYEVSHELLDKFESKFGNIVLCGSSNLNMSAAIVQTLKAGGVSEENIWVSNVSTPQATSRYFSYRKDEGLCGRHGAIAYLPCSK